MERQQPGTPSTSRRSRALPRVTGRVFVDLALWMAGLGVCIGLVFPLAIIPLGVPAEHSLRPGFYAATLSAGLLVGTLNFVLARSVVGSRLRALSRRMRFVSDAIEAATYSGDWSDCDPDDCSLRVDSADEIGEAAASFNLLLHALADSRRVESALGDYVRTLSAHLDIDALADAALGRLLGHVGADAGALLVTRDDGAAVTASHRLDSSGLLDSPFVAEGFDTDRTLLAPVPADLEIDAGVVSFRPAAVAVVPMRFKDTTVGVAVLAFAAPPHPERLQLLESLRGPTGVALDNALTHDRFQRLAAVDPLTGVYNRRFGLGRLREEFARSVRTGLPLGVVVFDLDHFKRINDTYGHLIGDEVLREVAATTRRVLREGDVLVRTGGEEFLVVLPGAGAVDVRAVGERLRRTVSSLVVAAGNVPVTVTLSAGGVSFPDVDAPEPDALVELADHALYRAKESGRDRFVMAPAAGAEATAAG